MIPFSHFNTLSLLLPMSLYVGGIPFTLGMNYYAFSFFIVIAVAFDLLAKLYSHCILDIHKPSAKILYKCWPRKLS